MPGIHKIVSCIDIVSMKKSQFKSRNSQSSEEVADNSVVCAPHLPSPRSIGRKGTSLEVLLCHSCECWQFKNRANQKPMGACSELIGPWAHCFNFQYKWLEKTQEGRWCCPKAFFHSCSQPRCVFDEIMFTSNQEGHNHVGWGGFKKSLIWHLYRR